MTAYRCIVLNLPPGATAAIAEQARGCTQWAPDPAGCHLWVRARAQSQHAADAILEALGFVLRSRWPVREAGSSGGDVLTLGVLSRLPQHRSARTTPRTTESAAIHWTIERVSPGPRLEMWAPRARRGWDVWHPDFDGWCEDCRVATLRSGRWCATCRQHHREDRAWESEADRLFAEGVRSPMTLYARLNREGHNVALWQAEGRKTALVPYMIATGKIDADEWTERLREATGQHGQGVRVTPMKRG
jgi:hypothetical protein